MHPRQVNIVFLFLFILFLFFLSFFVVVVFRGPGEGGERGGTCIDAPPANHPQTTVQPPVLRSRNLLLGLGAQDGGTRRRLDVADDGGARAA